MSGLLLPVSWRCVSAYGAVFFARRASRKYSFCVYGWWSTMWKCGKLFLLFKLFLSTTTSLPALKLEVSFLDGCGPFFSLWDQEVWRFIIAPNLFKSLHRSVTSLEVDLSKQAVGKRRIPNCQLTLQTLDFNVFFGSVLPDTCFIYDCVGHSAPAHVFPCCSSWVIEKEWLSLSCVNSCKISTILFGSRATFTWGLHWSWSSSLPLASLLILLFLWNGLQIQTITCYHH